MSETAVLAVTHLATGVGCFVLGWIGGWTARRKRWERTGKV